MSLTPGTSVFLFGNRATGKLRLVIATAAVEGKMPQSDGVSDGVYVEISPDQARHMLGRLAECIADVDPKDPS